ncbi:MAG: retroviral-like aspartic protease family protein [Tepidisphaeraceae bacterium]|jgi:predicted aspartyl protease
MGCFYINVTIRQIADRSKSAVVDKMLVDTGSEATWVPRRILEQLGITPEKKDRTFVMANGQRITRTVGYAIVEVSADIKTVDEVVFAEDGDLPLLGARSMEGLNVRVDPEGKQLVAAGPILAAGHLRVD